jgi:prolipoprotein diacylglyceryltransferase
VTVQGALVHPVIFRLGLPGGDFLAIRSYGVCLSAAMLIAWYLVVHAEHESSRKVRARAFAGAAFSGAFAGMVATFAGAAGAFVGLGVSALMFAVLAPSARDTYAPAFCALWILGGMGSWLDGWLYGTLASEGLASWGAFPTGSPAHIAHRARDLVDAASTHSRPTHPVALYHSLAGIVALPFAFRLRGGGLALPAVTFAFGGALLGLELLRADSFSGTSTPAIGLLIVGVALASAVLTLGHRNPAEG